MERFDVHVALEVCEIAIESATAVAILESGFEEKGRLQLRHFHHGSNRFYTDESGTNENRKKRRQVPAFLPS
jgi:hypothetical protein